jgi:hypothetical protein
MDQGGGDYVDKFLLHSNKRLKYVTLLLLSSQEWNPQLPLSRDPYIIKNRIHNSTLDEKRENVDQSLDQSSS